MYSNAVKPFHEILCNAGDAFGTLDFMCTKQTDGVRTDSVRADGIYESRTYAQAVTDIEALAKYLIRSGYKDKNILLYAENSYGWAVIDHAVMTYVGVSVTANKDWLLNDLVNVLDAIDIAAVFYPGDNNPGAADLGDSDFDSTDSDSIHHTDIGTLKSRYPQTDFFSIRDDLPDMLAAGADLGSAQIDLSQNVKTLDQIAKIVFSSGTTANPKAICLSQRNMLAGLEDHMARIPVGAGDRDYLFLPMNYTFAGVVNVTYAFVRGWTIYLNENTADIMSDFQIVKPTVLCCVPSVLEKVYHAISEEDMKKITKFIKISNTLLACKIDVRRSLFKKLHAVFGGELIYLAVGGAAFDRKVKKFFRDIGIKIVEAYALTETSSALSDDFQNDPIDSVGTIFDCCEVQIAAPDAQGVGEICVRGDNVFLGYYTKTGLLRDCIDEDGWFRTGDLGKLEGPHLYFSGRKKRMIVFSNGQNVFPDELEALLNEIDGVADAQVYEQGSRLHAIVFVDATPTRGASISEPPTRVDQFDADEPQEYFAEQIHALNETLPRYKQISSYEIRIGDKNFKS
ncbi:MAG: AMP-binding protein [Clostridiales Family XIII bacterium]|jgi:long-chain acyl-CoA synthetase|nr:AMP-binding protein [Clostridiales Family XIII bacterium]